MTDTTPVDDINRILAEGLAGTTTRVYHCDHCGEVWDVGHKARKHAVSEHGGLDGYRSEVVGE